MGTILEEVPSKSLRNAAAVPAALAMMAITVLTAPQVRADISLGGAANYAVLYEG
jgi:hypothetical protein